MKNRATNVVKYWGYATVIIMLLIGCAQKGRAPLSALDTPVHHVETGMRLLADHEHVDALKSFKSALELAPCYSSAWRGKGLVLGYQGKEKAALDAMTKARQYSENAKEKAEAYVGMLQLYTLFKGKQWLNKSEDAYNKAIAAVHDLPEAHYHMGIAYKDANNYDAAIKQFTAVLKIRKGLIVEADEQVKLVQRIQRALPGIKVGESLAGRAAITRADCAAIFIHELRIDNIYSRDKKRTTETKVSAIPADVLEHTLSADIRQIIQMGVRGLEVFPDGTFRPDTFITRASYAMMIEDIIGTVIHDNSLSTRYIGQPSPFPDVVSDAPYFNAIMVCATRGIMGAKDIMDGRFDPDGSISGADALLIIRLLKEKIRIY